MADISGKPLSKAYVNCDSWGSHEDWRVNENSASPMAPLKLIDLSEWKKFANKDKYQDDLYQDGWVYEEEAVLNWFQSKLGVKPEKRGGGSPEYTLP